MLRRIALSLVAAAIALPVFAAQYELGPLLIEQPWSRPTAPGMPMGVAYLSITNRGATADTLVGASSPVASRVEMHETSIVDGMARMRPLSAVDIPAGATVKIAPGGIHFMLIDLRAPLQPGKSVPLLLQFRHGGRITVQLEIGARDAP